MGRSEGLREGIPQEVIATIGLRKMRQKREKKDKEGEAGDQNKMQNTERGKISWIHMKVH